MSSRIPIHCSAPATFKAPVLASPISCKYASNSKFSKTNGTFTGKERVLLEPELMPKHVAVIMDGNRRWAKARGLTTKEGHEAGMEALKRMSCICLGMGIHTVSVFAFSTENWNRPKVDYLMELFTEFAELASEDADIQYKTFGGRVSMIGDSSKLPERAVRLIRGIDSDLSMRSSKGPQLLVALNYGGRQDIVAASRAIARKVKNDEMSIQEINEKLFEEDLQTNCTDFPSADFLIRTSGEKRTSNFMLWQTAHAELYFVDKCFPDLEEQDFVDAMLEYQRRKKTQQIDII